MAELWGDYLSWKIRYPFLKERPDGPPSLPSGKKRVLVASLTNWVCQVKQEAVLAKALQLKGYAPVIATYRKNRWAQRYFRLFGFEEFLYLEEFTDAGLTRRGIEQITALVSKNETFGELLQLEWEKVKIGQHLLSTIARHHFIGRVDPRDPETRRLVEKLIPEAVGQIVASRLLLEKADAGMALFNEKGYLPYAALFNLALSRGMNVIQYVAGHRQDAMVFKRYTEENKDQHPFSLSEETWELARSMEWNQERSEGVSREMKEQYESGTWYSQKFLPKTEGLDPVSEARRRLKLDPAKKTAVIFSHVLWDATFFYGRSLFSDYEEWLVETVRAARLNPAVNWVVKIHPDYVWKMKLIPKGVKIQEVSLLSSTLGNLPEHVRLLEPGTPISAHTLFDLADYALTVRGTIGIEFPCFGIPVLTAGTGRYSNLGFTIDSQTREEYLQRLRRIQDIPRLSASETELACRHAYALFKLRPCLFESFMTVKKELKNLGDPLGFNVRLFAESKEALFGARDLNNFASWAVESSDLDYTAGWASPEKSAQKNRRKTATVP